MELATQKQISYINYLAGDNSYTVEGSLQKGQASKIIEKLLKLKAKPEKTHESIEYCRIELMHSRGRDRDFIMGQRKYLSDFAAFDAAIEKFYK